MKTRSYIQTLGIALALSIGLLALSYIRIWGDAGSAMFRTKIIDAALSQSIWGTALGNNVITFAVAQAILHIGFGLICLAIAYVSKIAWPKSKHSINVWLLFWFLVFTVWILCANAALFPQSSLGAPYADVASFNWQNIDLFSAASVLLAAAILWTLVFTLLQTPKRALTLVVAPALAVTALMATLTHAVAQSEAKETKSTKPNVIIIGLDSLRTDVLNGASGRILTPNIDAFLAESKWFQNAITPLARTFPSWVSILTGRHPHTTGAVINLIPREFINTGPTLPQIFARAGYNTIYAIDESRFSNIDGSYGFNTTVTPPIGASDFVLGFFADTPLSNLIVNTSLGAILFPYSHANRAVSVTYEPDTFVERLNAELRFNEPTFFAAHLTLAHWPYTWHDSQVPSELEEDDPTKLYEAAVARLDEQFGKLITTLRDRGALNNALVVLLSDHGESIGEHASKSMGTGSILTSVLQLDSEAKILGHGTSVFAAEQYNVVLAFRAFGRASGSLMMLDRTPSIFDAPVSLIDLAPTLNDAFSLENERTFDGISLMPMLRKIPYSGESLKSRIRFTETEFNPRGFSPGELISESVIQSASAYYKVDPITDRVQIRTEYLNEILDNRQYAALLDRHMLAAVPDAKQPGKHVYIYVESPGAPPQLVHPTYLDGTLGMMKAALDKQFGLESPGILTAR